ncbi:unnamed protein product [Pipistrellus nathusii]|uniref:Uncharacterized protein n=1 Tax=Pipistrellus nathusii TaxID=59473 RepID=A0ABP0AG74_PIPNA
MCPLGASTREQGRDLASRKRQLCLEMTRCLSPRVQQETHPSDKESRSPHSLRPAPSCKKLWFAHLFSLSGALGPWFSLLSHQFLEKMETVDRKRNTEVGWLSSFTEKFLIHFSFLILASDSPKEMVADLFECKVEGSYT